MQTSEAEFKPAMARDPAVSTRSISKETYVSKQQKGDGQQQKQ